MVVVSDFCGAVTSVEVIITPCSITIPNVFTPNGDNKNNTFEIVGISGFPGSELLVYNRWGNLVYESANYDNSWFARDVPEGTYFFILRRSDGENYEGYVQILR
jgi:gliding motility-associated-like protein